MQSEATISHSKARRRRGFNDLRIEGDVAYLALTDMQGSLKGEVKIDVADLPALKEAGHRWCLSSYGYAFRLSDKKGVFLHRQLLNPAEGYQIDHINRDRLDCRRSNLRTVTHIENLRNRSPRKGSATGVRGVSPYENAKFPFWVHLGTLPYVFSMRVTTLNIGRITASLARAQHWGAEAA